MIESSPRLRSEQINEYSPNEQHGFVPLSVRLSDVALAKKKKENAKLFIPFLELRNNLSLTECALR